jgi:hypothetical protein
MHIKRHFRWCSICDAAKIFFTSKFGYSFFCNPTHKIEIETTNSGGTTNSKPLGPIIMMGQSEIQSSIQIIFITLFSAGAQHCCAFYPQPWVTVQLC